MPGGLVGLVHGSLQTVKRLPPHFHALQGGSVGGVSVGADGSGARALASAVGSGAPLHVRLFVPLWLVNATSMPISAGVVSLQDEEADDALEGLFEGTAVDAARMM